MDKRTLGTQGPGGSKLGLGAMGVSFRRIVNFTDPGVGEVNAAAQQVREDFVDSNGFGELLRRGEAPDCDGLAA